VADGPADRTTPTEVATAILTKPTPRFARMKTNLGVVSTAGILLFDDGKKTYVEPGSCVSAAVLFSRTFCKRIE
jgi:hypothetical protein